MADKPSSPRPQPKKKPSVADRLAAARGKNKPELTEEELKKVSGGLSWLDMAPLKTN